MQCEKFEARLQDLLDARQRPEIDAELAAHAEACEVCRELLALQEQLFAGLELQDFPPLKAGFAQQVVAQAALLEATAVAPAASAKGSPKKSQAVWIALGMGLAMALVAAVMPALNWLNERGANAPVAQQEDAPPAVLPAKEADLVEHVAVPRNEAARNPHVALPTEEFVAIARNADDLLTGRPAGEMVRTLSSRLPEMTSDPQVEQIPGLRPIASSFQLSIGVVRRTLPGAAAPKDNAASQSDKDARPVKPQAEYSREAVFGELV